MFNEVYWNDLPAKIIRVAQKDNDIFILFEGKINGYGRVQAGRIVLKRTTEFQVVHGIVEYKDNTGNFNLNYVLEGKFDDASYEAFSGNWREEDEIYQFDLFLACTENDKKEVKIKNDIELFRDYLVIAWLRHQKMKNTGGKAGAKFDLRKRHERTAFRITRDFSKIPLHYRAYIEQNRIFEWQVYALFESEKENKNSKNLFELLSSILSCLSQLESLVAQYETQKSMNLDTYRAEKATLARDLETCLHDLNSSVESIFYDDDIDVPEKFENLIKAGFELAEYWIDARL